MVGWLPALSVLPEGKRLSVFAADCHTSAVVNSQLFFLVSPAWYLSTHLSMILPSQQCFLFLFFFKHAYKTHLIHRIKVTWRKGQTERPGMGGGRQKESQKGRGGILRGWSALSGVFKEEKDVSWYSSTLAQIWNMVKTLFLTKFASSLLFFFYFFLNMALRNKDVIHELQKQNCFNATDKHIFSLIHLPNVFCNIQIGLYKQPWTANIQAQDSWAGFWYIMAGQTSHHIDFGPASIFQSTVSSLN